METEWVTCMSFGFLSACLFYYFYQEASNSHTIIKAIDHGKMKGVAEVLRSDTPPGKKILVHGKLVADLPRSNPGTISEYHSSESYHYGTGIHPRSEKIRPKKFYTNKVYLADMQNDLKRLELQNFLGTFREVEFLQLEKEKTKPHDSFLFGNILSNLVNIPIGIIGGVFHIRLKGTALGSADRSLVLRMDTPLFMVGSVSVSEFSSSAKFLFPQKFIANSLSSLRSKLESDRNLNIIKACAMGLGTLVCLRYFFKLLSTRIVESGYVSVQSDSFQRHKSSIDQLDFQLTCIICETRLKTEILLPCGHCVFCAVCFYEYVYKMHKNKCPMCKLQFTDRLKINYV